MAATGEYPVRVDASLDTPLSRWLWLVKWLLLIPHAIVLAMLWLAFVVLSVAAFFAILFTGVYPRAIFEFNAGVLRWTWRVLYYAIGAFGTDRYPPFTLADDPSYPAHLKIDYPRRLSRGLVLVKWWLLAIPHYIIIGLFTGSAATLAWRVGNQDFNPARLGLIGILAIIAGLVLLVTGRYPAPIYDFIMGMNRWVLRVAAYASLMTDEYPPFRLDTGGYERGGGALTIGSPPGQGPAQAGWQPGGPGGAFTGQEPRPPATGAAGWTGGRIASLVIGALLAFCSLALLGTGGAAVWADTAARHGSYVDLGSKTFSTSTYAIASETVELDAAGVGWDAAQSLFGTVRIRATSTSGAAPVFIGIAPAGAASGYLTGVNYATVRGVSGNRLLYTRHPGTAPTAAPVDVGIWTTQASGPGTQTLTWPVRSGRWMVVAMNADASRPVSVRASIAATIPSLGWIAAGLLAAGVIAMAVGVILIAIPVMRASRSQTAA